ncbi:MAG: hypothetical protein HY698_07520, partial [Deltaproteobacteria bacterium]|nr:hypothetical protein [Deltaproteobacteria bacterium]
EPFGHPLDAYRELAGGGSETGAIDFGKEPLNTLNKETDPNTGWSYHGARWTASESARWLTPDPPVKGPDPKFMRMPWDLHPYQYVRQNPVAYWDPDGNSGEAVALGCTVGGPVGCGVGLAAEVALYLGAGALLGYLAAKALPKPIPDQAPPLPANDNRPPANDNAPTSGPRGSVDIVPPVPNRLPKPDSKEDDEQSKPYRMRVQIQRGKTHISSVAIMSDQPITAQEVNLAFLQAIANVPNGYAGITLQLSQANDEMLERLVRRVRGGGVTMSGNVERVKVKGTGIRLDLENLEGHNLRSLY